MSWNFVKGGVRALALLPLCALMPTEPPAEPTPHDWCYVNNFKQPHKPQALQLPAGRANDLRQDMSQLVEALITVIPAALNSDIGQTS